MTPDPWCEATFHGTVRAYRKRPVGCRCTCARELMADYEATRARNRKAGQRLIVDGIGTRRRLQALAVAGWSSRDLEPFLYVTAKSVQKWRAQDTISARNAAKVADLYDRIGLEDGPTRRSRRHARRMGWRSPMEWGPNIDDPKAKPIDVDAPLNYHGRATPIEDIELLAMSGETWEQTVTRLGSSKSVIDKRLRRVGRYDILARLSSNSEAGLMMARRDSGAYDHDRRTA